MSNFLTLTKVFFLSGFNVNRRKKNQKSAFALFATTLGLFAFASFFISFNFLQRMELVGLESIDILSLMLIMSFMLNFVLSIHQVQSIIFNTRDYEFLESLPVKKTTIVAAKLSSFYLINAAEDIALILPAAIMYLLMGHGQIIPALIAILCSLVICVIPILLSAIIGSLSALISSKSKHFNLINILVSVIFLLILFAGYIFLMLGDTSSITSFMDKVFFLKWLKTGISGELANILYYYLFSLGVFVLVVLFISLIYQPVNTWLHSKNNHVDYDKVKKAASKQNQSLDHVLLKKEWYMVSKRPQYLLNCIIAPLIFMIMGVLAIIFPSMFAGGSEDMSDESLKLLVAVAVFLVPPMGILMNSFVSSSACSISFETRYGYEMLRSYPIDKKKIIKAKVLIALILSCSSNILSSIVLVTIAVLRGLYQPYYLIPLVLYPQLTSILVAFVGMLTGLRWPKLDFENEAQVMKNSAAANFLALFVTLPAALVFGLSYTADLIAVHLDLEFIHYISVGVVLLIFAIAIPIVYSALKRNGEALFDRIIDLK